MTVRTIFMALSVPLFLLMAAVNGAVLYFQEQSEMSRALTEQARAAAIVTAEFIAEMDDPGAELTAPLRQDAINAASDHIVGLQGLYLVERSGTLTPLAAGSMPWSPPVQWSGVNAQATVLQDDTSEASFFAAIHPAGEGRAVAARIDAAPLLANRAEIIQIILSIILGVSVFAAALSWFVAQRIVRELRWNGLYLANSAAFPGPEQTAGAAQLKIRETRDLSDAAALMNASREAAETRHRRDAERSNQRRDIHTASRQLHTETFPNGAFVIGDTEIAVRICGNVPPGAFYALATADDECGSTHVVIGRCLASEPDTDLANAAAARRFIEDNFVTLGRERCLSLAKQAFEIETLDWIACPGAQTDQHHTALLCDTEEQTASNAHRIVQNSGDLTPDQTLNAIESLLNPVGIFVTLGRRNNSAGQIKPQR